MRKEWHVSLKALIDALLFWVSQWVGVTLPLVATIMVGLVLCTASVTALWTRRIKMASALSGLVLGLFLVLIGLDTRFLHGLVSASDLTRIRLLMGLLSVFVIAVTFESVRRSRLKERYALLWLATGGMILLCAFFPSLLEVLTALFGMQYVTAVGVLMFVFFIALLFHVSLALSNLQADETSTAQRCALLEAKIDKLSLELGQLRGAPPASLEAPAPDAPPREPSAAASSSECFRRNDPFMSSCLRVNQAAPSSECVRRNYPGFAVAAPVLIAAACLAVLWAGLRAPQAMIGDEVTHYHMLQHQASVLPSASFQAHIPTGWGETEIRNYPHANLWHYAGAWLYRWNPAFAVTQVYQALFLAQLLWAAFGLVRKRNGASTPAIVLYVLLVGSLPAALLFSVAFYQDVALAAQVLSAFLMLDRRRWGWAAVFMALAIGVKEPAVLFAPAFLAMLACQRVGDAKRAAIRGIRRVAWIALPLVVTCLALWVPMQVSAQLIRRQAGGEYYPYEQARAVFNRVSERVPWLSRPATGAPVAGAGETPEKRSISTYEAGIIANHPGDLRQPINWVLYGGIVMWVVLFCGLLRGILAATKNRNTRALAVAADLWPLWVGLSYLVPSAILLKTAPDARFFLPAVPFVLLPFAESFSKLPRQRVWMSILVSVALVQSGFVLSKAIQLRQVTPALAEAIRFLARNPPPHDRVFMYPEGNYRLFSVRHDWYLGYKLREFWRGDNDYRLQLLATNHVGAIVVKKHLVAPVDTAITNLGVYPDYFVRDVEADGRFEKVFDNPAVSIYRYDSPSLQKPTTAP
jgi:hypothetical protein